MIKINRIENELVSKAKDVLEQEKNKNNGDYKKEEVIKALNCVFHQKCYLCESLRPTALQVEHFKPHRQNKDLLFDWNNLCLSCAHCNNTKLAKYDNILDCTQIDVDKLMSFRIIDTVSGSSEVKVEVLENPEIEADVEVDVVDMTAELLNNIYAGTTMTKKLEANEIRTKISEEMDRLRSALKELNYAKESGNQDDIKDQICLIEKLLKARQPYAAFKRWYIKDYSTIFPEIRL